MSPDADAPVVRKLVVCTTCGGCGQLGYLMDPPQSRLQYCPTCRGNGVVALVDGKYHTIQIRGVDQ